MPKRKRKRDLYATFEHIERFHRRRMIFVIHIVALLAVQVALWSNWYGSYYTRGYGFRETLLYGSHWVYNSARVVPDRAFHHDAAARIQRPHDH